MEAVKSAIINGVQERHGPCVVQIDEQCMNISVQKHPDHIIYVRQDDRQKQYVCHYVHRADVARRLCGVCTCRIEKFEDVPTTNMEYDDQPFGVRRKRAPVAEPPCLCGLDTDLHAWRQRKAFQLVRTVVRIVFFFLCIAVAFDTHFAARQVQRVCENRGSVRGRRRGADRASGRRA